MTNFVCNYDTSDWGWDGGAVLSDVMPCANGDASSSSDSRLWQFQPIRR